MICKDFEGLIEDYQDGRLDEELAASMQIHLGGCPACKAALVAMKAEQRLYQGYREALEQGLEVPAAMWPRVRAGIEAAGTVPPPAREDSAQSGWRNRWLPSFGGAHWMRQLGFAALLIVLSVAGTLFVVHYQRRETANARLTPGAAAGAHAANIMLHNMSPLIRLNHIFLFRILLFSSSNI